MSKYENIPANKGWHFMIDGPCVGTWTPVQYTGAILSELELPTPQGTTAKYIRHPICDAPGIFAFKFEGELSPI